MEYKITDKFTKERIKAIQKLEKKNMLTAENLVNESKNKDHPWHNDIYKYNDGQAAYLYRLQRAREIINQVKIIINDKELYAYENVNITINETETERKYVSINTILDNLDYRNQILAAAIKEIKVWKAKYSIYKELESIFDSIDHTASNLQDVI